MERVGVGPSGVADRGLLESRIQQKKRRCESRVLNG